MTRGPSSRKHGHNGRRRHDREQRCQLDRFSSANSQQGQLPRPTPGQSRLDSIYSQSELWNDYKGEAKIENVEYVASYSWVKDDNDNAVIFVPGMPPRWQPQTSTQTLSEDSGSYYVDPNSARYPSFPTEPAMRAVWSQSVDFNLAEIDVFACGSTIGSLLEFLKNEASTFRFGVELIGSSLFFVRRTYSEGEKFQDVRGYCHTFPDLYTVWDEEVKDSISHQRIIKYDFAGLKCFVRSKSDGYLPTFIETPGGSADPLYNGQYDHPYVGTSDARSESSPSQHEVTLRDAGNKIPQGALFDLKTRTLRSENKERIVMKSSVQQLWVKQIPNMILAYHTDGTFEPSNIHVIDARDEIAKWEAANSTLLAKLASLLHWLIGMARTDSGPCFEVRRLERGPIELWSETPV